MTGGSIGRSSTSERSDRMANINDVWARRNEVALKLLDRIDERLPTTDTDSGEEVRALGQAFQALIPDSH
jgi:hypothetical protein